MKKLSQLIGSLLILLLSACSDQPQGAVKYSAQEQQIIDVAKQAVGQYEDWGDRAEYQISRSGGIWTVIARRVEHAEAKGNMRYVPWGRREIVIDANGKVVSYGTGK